MVLRHGKWQKNITSKLQVFVNRCLRRILNIHWPEVILNEELWRRAEETEISVQIRRRKRKWIGHTLRKGQDTIQREVMDWNPQGQRKRGRPKQTWRRSVHSEALGERKSWDEVKQLAKNKIRWRRFVDVLCPWRNNRIRWWWLKYRQIISDTVFCEFCRRWT